MKKGRNLIRVIHDGSPPWFYACLMSLIYLPVAYFLYTIHQNGLYAVVGYLIFSGLYREGASIRQNNRFALELSFLAEDHAEMMQKYEAQIFDLRKELQEINASIELLGDNDADRRFEFD